MDKSASSHTCRLIIGVDWSDAAPRVRLRDGDAGTSRLQPLVGLRLNYNASPDSLRCCVGHTPFRRAEVAYVDCAKPPESGARKCRQCSIVDATFASNLHHAHTKDRADIDPAVAEHLRQPNLLYLAAFRDGSIKVGTTTQKRRDKRLREQGAWRAVVLARADDGYAVRVAEDAVTVELGVTQSVSIGRKLDGMVTPKPNDALESLLGETADAVRKLLKSLADPKVMTLDEAWERPGSDHADWIGLHRYPLRLDSGSHDLEVSNACGRMVVLRRPGGTDAFIADVGQLFGVELALGDYESDELVVQDSLF